jgi:Uma2 family endonuclease
VNGRMVAEPSPAPMHNMAAFRLATQLGPQLPAQLRTVLDVDVDLELAPPDRPGFSRRPDLTVVRCDGLERVGRDGGLLKASDVVVAVEIVSPRTRRTDRVAKYREYAEAGIPHYWIVDLEPPVSLLACHLAGNFGYRDSGEATGRFATAEPFDVLVELDELVTI